MSKGAHTFTLVISAQAFCSYLLPVPLHPPYTFFNPTPVLPIAPYSTLSPQYLHPPYQCHPTPPHILICLHTPILLYPCPYSCPAGDTRGATGWGVMGTGGTPAMSPAFGGCLGHTRGPHLFWEGTQRAQRVPCLGCQWGGTLWVWGTLRLPGVPVGSLTVCRWGLASHHPCPRVPPLHPRAPSSSSSAWC